MANITLKFDVAEQTVNFDSRSCTQLIADSKNVVYAQFAFGMIWSGVAKTAIFSHESLAGAFHVVLEADGSCKVPAEVIKSPKFSVSVFGGDLVTASKLDVRVDESGLVSGTTPPAPTPDVYNQILSISTEAKATANQAKALANDEQNTASVHAAAAQVSATQAGLSQADAETSKISARDSAVSATNSATSANGSKTSAELALSDLLAMMGTDVATLVGGKIPITQIPATATQEIYTIASESELTGLVAQRGDIAELVETTIGGVRTITKTWQCLDSTVISNWIVWGTSYAVQAGNATTATNAVNSTMINNHRMVEMAQSEFDTAVKDGNTYYLVH